MSVASLLIVAAAAPPSVPSLRAAPPALGVRRDFAAGLAEAVHIDPTARAASTRRLAKGGGSSSLAECVDTDDGATDSEGYGCAEGYTGFDSAGVDLSSYCGSFDDDDFNSLVMCCACKTPP